MKRSLLWSVALLSSVAAAQVTYCTPTSTGFNCVPNGGDEFISNVAVSNLSNSSLCGAPPGYEDYSATVPAAILLSGQTYGISVSVGRAWNTDHVYVMLDVNGDGVFQTGLGGNELLTTLGPISGVAISGTGTVVLSGNITIPATLVPTVRLRVRLSFGTLPGNDEACATNSYGNCEDYTASTVGAPPPPEYQVNQSGSSLDFDGVQGFAYVPAGVVTRCINSNFNMNMMSVWGGLPFDILLGSPTLVPRSGGGYVSPSGTQVVNINLATMSFAFGGFTTSFLGNFTLAASLGTPLDIGAQMVNFDPTHIDTVSVSQACSLQIIDSASIVGFVPPSGDDNTAMLPAPVCIPFYGTIQSNAWISTNGRVGFGTNPNSGYFPSEAGAMTGDPFVGYWCDLNVFNGGTISATKPGLGLTRIQWNAVPYYGTAINNTFAFQFDANTKTVWVDLIPTIAFSSGGSAFLGMSKGQGATDPGQVAYQVGGNPSSGMGVAGPGMIYTLATEGTGLTGLSGILFSWNNGSQNYDWTGL